jgi:hypothetical protein
VKGFFSIELLFIFFLFPCLFYVLEVEPPPILRETEVYTQDVAQMLTYGHSPEELPKSSFAVWVDGQPVIECPYKFRYCTRRFYEGGEHRICAAECLR